MKFRLTSTFLIAALMTSALLNSCQSPTGTNDTASDTTVDSTPVTSSDTTDDYGYIDPGIEKQDFGGRDFNIVYPEWSLYMNYYFSNESNGDIVNDAIYERSRRVEENFNIKLNYVTYGDGKESSVFSAVQTAVLAGISDYDLALTHCVQGVLGLVSSALVLDWNSLPGVDLTKPYWNQSVRENFEVDGVLPIMAGDYILPDVNAIFFNKDLIDRYGLENPYKLTLDGSWTWDKLRDMAKQVSSDLNGDSVMDENDQYGFVGELDWQFASALTSCGQLIAGSDGETVELVCNNEKTQSILDMLSALIHRDDISFTWNYKVEYDPNNGGTPPVDFGNGRALFYLTPLSLATTFRDANIEYGILPFPKYDESQSDYITLNWSGFMCVPATVSDPGLVGQVTEMLSAESCRTVIPAFFDVLLGEKIARDEDAKETLGIIFDSAVYDPGVNLGLYSIVYTQLASDAPDNSAYIAKNIGQYEKAIDDYVKGCQDYNK